MIPFLVDSHCHLHFPPYEPDLDAVLLSMRKQRVWGITIGTSVSNSARTIAFAEKHEEIWAAVGVHPEHLTSDFHDEEEGVVEAVDLQKLPDALTQLARSSKKVVAIGETGLDYYRMDEGRDIEEGKRAQTAAFLMHLRAAQTLDLPLVIHCREALGDLAALVQAEANAGRTVRGVVHSFTGTWEEAKPLLDLGLFIAVNGIATFPPRKGSTPGQSLDRTIERIPLERLLVETDAPYLAPMPYRGKRNEPAYVEEVAKYVAKVRGMTLEEVAEITTANAMSLFKLFRAA